MTEDAVDLEGMLDLTTPWCLRVAATLRIPEHIQTGRSFGVAGRVTVEGQSFFDPLPAGADLYLLKSVLNDWPDEPTVAILRRCAEAARTAQPEGAVAILGGVSADEAPRSLGIDMLVAGGKTSTLAQFTVLAQQAGLAVKAARTQSSGRFVVECRPRELTQAAPRANAGRPAS